jgi:hypothetical protein
MYSENCENCKICDSELSAAEINSHFCKTCGSKAEPDEAETEVTAHYYHVGPDNAAIGEIKHKRKFIRMRFVALICVVLLAASGGIFFAVRPGHKPDDANLSLKLNVLFEPSLDFQHISYFSEGLAVVSTGSVNTRSHNWKYGYIDMTGKTVIPLIYDWAMDFSEGLAAVRIEGKSGFIDKNGEEALPFIYDNVNSFSGGLAAVSMDGKWGYIDITGDFVIPLMYDGAQPFFNGLAVVHVTFNPAHGTKCGIIDKDGNTVVPVEYDWIWFNAMGGFYQTSKDSKQGLLDISGNVILECIYDIINFSMADGTIQARLGNSWGIFKIEDYEIPGFMQYSHGGLWW